MDSKVILQFIRVLFIIIFSHIFTGYFTYTFVSRLKSGNYLLPIFNGRINDHYISSLNCNFSARQLYLLLGAAMIQPLYFLGTYLVFQAHGLSLQYFNVAYISVITNILVLCLTTVFFMWVMVDEVPNRYEWGLLVIAAILAVAGAFKQSGNILSK